MRFTKMHGTGNDYVYVNGFEERVEDPEAMAVKVADRHFGIGGDGLILVLPPEPGVDANVRMRMFNADGSEAEMCGNGIRCVCKLAHDRGICTANPMRVQTGNGVLTLDYAVGGDGKVECVTVDMGQPVLELPKIAVDTAHLDPTDDPHVYDLFDVAPNNIENRISAVFVSMGNPHAVIYTDAVERDIHLALGRRLEHHPAFPARMNLHFVHVVDPTRVDVLHWERGSGPTLACGTGACAVCVAGVLTGHTARKITTTLPGGDLTIEWQESDNHVHMTGPATEVFSGEWPNK